MNCCDLPQLLFKRFWALSSNHVPHLHELARLINRVICKDFKVLRVLEQVLAAIKHCLLGTTTCTTRIGWVNHVSI